MLGDIVYGRDVLEYSEAEAIEARIDLERALERLAPWQRRVLGMWLEGYTQQEIAKALGMSQQFISKWLKQMKIE